MTCEGCAYRKYVGDGKSICTHRKLQLTLAKMGIVQMRVKDYPKQCPNSSAKADKELIGARDPYYLQRLQKIDRVSTRKANDHQTSMF